ncbi:hypothetical protein ACQ1Q1_05395 [Ornithobacterium rhinotracheale]|uniref:Uncharacterized protein n=1 Tax=Ornithobacterium rhinotracheale (strain ATCC 51463 / DSM 15997 / CCUG 23171 / CIP 104009 / LMG 9086) TaxID=867902 RepID=I4A0S0_ORNRL|nr:hypothetical protein [Ornithobacterium rhinotracheale]AFL97554.1 hypothetical protein Ornrh_1381 [Ornithobacterium rhinotracheale DSM 15997]AIP98923.1 hypothetical protein Q785_03020 [Ornithobacterium rhinotracheale ORT-UMN 88]KGB67217.1 hypothetical protein Q787_02870 [Ornithobacterium rhinotracheale H06-030791]MCK0195080.1 hypothetical protein [Ornithobacterium rhinotracheale]MCK0203861.1 hypothetical protein [Ornithobacterium rhinotracheale]
MKKLFTLFLGLWMINAVFAECASGNLIAFPQNEKVSQNSLFMIEGYMLYQDIVQFLGNKYPVYLKSEQEKIPLQVVEYCKGEYDLEQVILKPQRLPKAGVTYVLFVDNLPEYLNTYENGKRLKNRRLNTYYILNEQDTKKPTLSGIPKFMKSIFEQYGCGNDVYAIFSNSAKDDDSEIWVKTTVKNLDTGEVMQYYIKPFNGKLYVGHGMCSGAFNFGDSKQFSVVFSFMDSSGNVSDANIEPVIFENPIYHKKSK